MVPMLSGSGVAVQHVGPNNPNSLMLGKKGTTYHIMNVGEHITIRFMVGRTASLSSNHKP